MTRKTQVWLSWSSGKDSAHTLYVLRQQPDIAITALLTTVDESTAKAPMHATRMELLKQQADSISLPLIPILLPSSCTNPVYEQRMKGAMEHARRDGVQAIAFGDLYLEDIRSYREKMLAPTGLNPVFPLWKRNTKELAREMIDSGLRAIVTSVDKRLLNRSFVGRTFDEKLLADLPSSVDPCGENGEFHTFVFESPVYSRSVAIKPGSVTESGPFVHLDLIPGHE